MLANTIQAVGHPLGFANPALYQLNGSQALRDIVPVDPADPPIVLGAHHLDGVDPSVLSTFGKNDTLTAAVGFVNSTGLGAPASSFVDILAGALTRP